MAKSPISESCDCGGGAVDSSADDRLCHVGTRNPRGWSRYARIDWPVRSVGA